MDPLETSTRILEILKRHLTLAESAGKSDASLKELAELDTTAIHSFLDSLDNYKPSTLKSLEDQIRELKYEQAKDRQRIAELESYLQSKNGSHRDFSLLSVKLMKEVLSQRRGRGMDYRDVLNFFHFQNNEEAYRLMRKTASMYPLDLKLIKRNHSKRKLIIISHENALHSISR